MSLLPVRLPIAFVAVAALLGAGCDCSCDGCEGTWDGTVGRVLEASERQQREQHPEADEVTRAAIAFARARPELVAEVGTITSVEPSSLPGMIGLVPRLTVDGREVRIVILMARGATGSEGLNVHVVQNGATWTAVGMTIEKLTGDVPVGDLPELQPPPPASFGD